ncbi:glycosyltransferase family 39 protein [Solitalea sp. MAHUQ-68]|uniref:Glycosyltransferase family 39 protein n=1 Tax=Solitalea agri TaxID=2953739 RepID=A0A9X2F0T5_9SPHI|nr:glycosyltransferase family 39 protein [Solitalea agri]MCO4292607.1 glycosyltransferase family 39 protein [Solitalea agri]
MRAKYFMAVNRNGVYTSVIMLLAVLLYFSYLGKTPIYILDEAKNAQCAREMFDRSDWVVPTFNQELRTDKPPFHYYCMMTAFKLFGVNEFSARFFSAIFGLLTLLITYYFVRKHLGQKKAFMAVLVLLSSLHFTFEMRLAVPDPYLIFLLSACLFSIFTFIQTEKNKFLWFTYIAMGLGILCKGPLAVLLPGLIVFVYLIVTKDLSFKRILSFKPLLGLFVVLIISLPWYLAVDKATNGAWVKGFLLNHNVHRFTDVKEGHGGFFGLTTLYILIGFLPFSVFIVQIIKKSISNWANPFIKFSVVTVLTFWLFFTVSDTQLPNYPMPAYPFMALLIGNYLFDVISGIAKGSFQIPLMVYLIITLVLPMGIYLALKNEPPLARFTYLAIPFLVLPISACITRLLWSRNQIMGIAVMSGAFILTSFIFFSFIYPKVYSQNPVVKSLGLIQTGRPVVAFKKYNPGYNFYLNHPIKRFTDVDSLRRFIELHPNCVLITREGTLADLKSIKNIQIVFSGKDLFEKPVTVLLTTTASYETNNHSN